uniref:Outer membrane protein beta-barrel domain-containing protein n=1 Tax=candidate division WOR-3 bacterium TaxID=2052148 RepID=A0A7C3J759_UNCW3
MVKKILISILIIFVFLIPSYSKVKQKKNKVYNIFNISFNPQIYFEPIEENNTLYLNLFPFSTELAFSEKNGIKFLPVVGLKLYSYGVRFGQLGLSFSIPTYQKGRSKDGAYSGYFTSGYTKVVYNQSESYTAFTLANENGFSFYFKENLSLSFSIQAGYTYFFFSDPSLNKGIIFSGFSLSTGIWVF